MIIEQKESKMVPKNIFIHLPIFINLSFINNSLNVTSHYYSLYIRNKKGKSHNIAKLHLHNRSILFLYIQRRTKDIFVINKEAIVYSLEMVIIDYLCIF